MSLFAIAWKNLRQRKLATFLTATSVAIAVMLAITVVLMFAMVSRTFNQNSTGYDLIVGPKGSEFDLVLNTIYRIPRKFAQPLPYQYYLDMQEEKGVEFAVPFAQGDFTEQGAFPIVATTSKFFEIPFKPGQNFYIVGQGTKMKNPFDAVIGWQVAQKNKWGVGTKFKMIHGGQESDHVHHEEFEVVAVLAETHSPNDRTVFVNIEGFFMVDGHHKDIKELRQNWLGFFGPDRLPKFDAAAKKFEDEHKAHAGHAHHHHAHAPPDELKELTSILVVMARRPGRSSDAQASFAVEALRAKINRGFKAMATAPLAPMLQLRRIVLGKVEVALLVFSGFVLAVAGIGLFVSMYNSMADRKREIAVMRALGARRSTVSAVILFESLIICLSGALFGLLLGHGLAFVAAPIVEASSGLMLNPFEFELAELIVLPVMILFATLVGALPAMTAYRTDVASSLAE